MGASVLQLWLPQIQCHAVAWSEESWNMTQFGLGCLVRWSQKTRQLLEQIPHFLAWGAKPLCLSQMITVPSLHRSCPVVAMLCRGGGASVVFLCPRGQG